MPTGLYLSILKPFITPLGSIVTTTICLLTTLKNCMRGYVLCRQLSWQNFSFYFVPNLDTGPSNYFICKLTKKSRISSSLSIMSVFVIIACRITLLITPKTRTMIPVYGAGIATHNSIFIFLNLA